MTFYEAGALTYVGGTIAGNGGNSLDNLPVPLIGWGVYVANGNSNPYVSNATWGASFIGVQFEGNCGLAHAAVVGSGTETYGFATGFLFSGCSFLRTPNLSTANSATFCISLGVAAGPGGTAPAGPPLKTSLVVIGCGFSPTVGYTPSASTPYIGVLTGDSFLSSAFSAPYQVTHWGNVWQSTVEVPTFRGPVEGPNALASSYVVFDGTSGGSGGGTCTISSSAPYNVSSVWKIAKGEYVIQFQKALTDSSYAVSGGVNGITPGFLQVSATTSQSIAVNTFNASGAATDFSRISVTSFGSNALLAFN